MNIFGKHDERTIQQLERCVAAEPGAIGVLCADGHLGYSMPIGGVVGYRNFVSPSGVGYDIACGNLATLTNLKADEFTPSEWNRVADEIQSRVAFGIGQKNSQKVDHPVIEQISKSSIPEQAAMAKLAADQLGTVGSGNHYVDIFEDEVGRIWIGVHFGSRGFGHKTAKGFMNVAQGRDFADGSGEGEMDAPPLLLDINGPAGQDYIEAMQLAGFYAYAGREAVVTKVREILGASALQSIHNHHNFAWLEQHNGNKFWVVRKGATPAFPGQLGFVGGSMGDISVILKGVDSPASAEALYSTVHGAGRVMSRTQAAGKQKWHKAKWTCGNYRQCNFSAPIATFERARGEAAPKCPNCANKLIRQPARMERLANGLVDFEAEKLKLTAVLRGAGADEAPPVYRPLQSVLDAHAGTIEVLHTLKPLVVVMAGGNEHDPYKD